MDERIQDLTQQRSEGVLAQQLMEQLDRYFSSIRGKLVSEFLSADPAEKYTLQMIRLRVSALDQVWGEMENVVATGKLAELELEGEIN